METTLTRLSGTLHSWGQLFRLRFANIMCIQTCDKFQIVCSDCFITVSHFAHFSRKQYKRTHFYVSCLFRTLWVAIFKPAIHLLSNWREHEKMLAKWEKWEAYRWHFVNHLANHFSHLVFQTIGIFKKHQIGW